MSMWVKQRTEALKDVEKDVLLKALKDMGIETYETNTVENSYGSTEVDYGFKLNGEKISLGVKFVKDEENKINANVVGDFWNTGLDSADFTNELSRKYQQVRIVNRLQNNGFAIDNIKQTKKKEIIIKASHFI